MARNRYLKKLSKRVTEITAHFYEAGFSVPSFTILPTTPNICYVENMLHYTIIPGLEVYKCTARDFKKDSVNYIGNISDDGAFISNDNILRYYCNSFLKMKSVENVKSFQYAEETVFRNVLKK